ncbi:unnamed protein product [Mytilus edulis]|uniref:Tc1-like transposase DDE domain-containing protein n=1 Tax=Mytilus edulis TaxID=6550 RepID=A0A8S3QHS3_MYTED|nr:unnamed protein product [Mytilus edulis]
MGRQMGYQCSVFSRLVRKNIQTKNVKDLQRSGRPLVISQRDNFIGGGSVMVWSCISHDCKLDLVTMRGNLNGDQYIREVLQSVVEPNFDNHSLAARLVFMDDDTRPRHSRTVTAFRQGVTALPWPAMSPELNPIEHIWDTLGRRVQTAEQPVKHLRQLESPLHREWQHNQKQTIRRLTGWMRTASNHVVVSSDIEY